MHRALILSMALTCIRLVSLLQCRVAVKANLTLSLTSGYAPWRWLLQKDQVMRCMSHFGRLQFDDNGDWSDSHPILSLQDCKPAPFKKFQLRLKNFGGTFSFRHGQEYLLQYIHPECHAPYSILFWSQLTGPQFPSPKICYREALD